MSQELQTRYSLLERARDAEDEAAWADLSAFYWQLVTGWARGMGCDASRAQDVFQETMVCLLRQLPSLELTPGRGRFRCWLKTVVRRRAIDLHRRESRYAEEPRQDDFADASVVTDISSDREWMAALVARALRRTRERVEGRTWDAFSRVVLDGEPAATVAAALDLRPGTLVQLKSRLLQSLRRELLTLLSDAGELPQGGSSPPGLSAALDTWLGTLRGAAACGAVPAELAARLRWVSLQLVELPADADALLIEPGRRQPLQLDKAIDVGREDDCDWVLHAFGVSGRHARLTCGDGRLELLDLGSTNGTWLNNRRISQTFVRPGDVIQMGDATVVLG